MKKKILFVISTLRMGGAEKALISLLNCLDNSLVDVDLLVFESNGILKDSVPKWVRIIETDDLTKAMTLEARSYLKPIISKGFLFPVISRVYISILNKINLPKFSWAIVNRYVKPLNEKYDVAIGFLEDCSNYYVLDKTNANKKIGWIHIDLSNRKMLQEEIEYYNRFDHIVTISEKCLDAAVEAIPGIHDKITVIRNVVSKEEIMQKSNGHMDLPWDSNKINLLTVGRLEYQKGIDIAANAAKILKERGVDFHWHVFGVGNMESSINQYINDNNIGDVFILNGLVPNPYPYMKRADIIVQPSRWEGKSIVLDEAKILGKAIVVTNYASVDDQIENNKTGLIVAIEPADIASGIERLMSNSELKKQLETNCMNDKNNTYDIIEQFYSLIGV